MTAISAFWGRGLPSGLEKDVSLVVLVINVVAPGLGTIISAFLADSFSSEPVYVGIFQILLSIIGIGYIWAVVWGVLLVRKSGAHEGEEILPVFGQGNATTVQAQYAPVADSVPAENDSPSALN